MKEDCGGSRIEFKKSPLDLSKKEKKAVIQFNDFLNSCKYSVRTRSGSKPAFPDSENFVYPRRLCLQEIMVLLIPVQKEGSD